MDLLFMTSLEKKVIEGESRLARVLVGERQGKWMIQWNETDEAGKPEEEVWYDGTKWDDMMVAFRVGLQQRMRDGYVTLLNVEELRERSKHLSNDRISMLQYYGEHHVQTEIYEKLKGWRSSQSMKENNAPYILASNRQLQMISAFIPHTPEELRQIPGFGESRTSKYATAILTITMEYERTTSFPLGWVEELVDQNELSNWSEEQQRLKEKAQQARQMKRLSLLNGIASGERLQELSERLNIPRRDLIREVEQLDKEGYDMEPLVAQELSSVNTDQLNQAQALFGEIGDRFLKPIVEKMFTKEQLKSQNLEHIYEWLRLMRMGLRRSAEASK